MRIVCFGPGPKFKGGIQNYNTSLAKAFDALGEETFIVSWTNQYPSIIPREFIDKSSKGDLLQGTGIEIKYITNYNNPFSWSQTAAHIISLKPDIVIFQWSIAIQGLPIASIAARLKKSGLKVLFDLHFVIQKEGSKLDRNFTLRALKYADAFIVHAQKTIDELNQLFPGEDFEISEKGWDIKAEKRSIVKLYHPVYQMFKKDESFDRSAFAKGHDLKKNVFLFFGFIRKYKGLHFAIEAFAELSKKRDDVSLIICGESFWNTLDEKSLSTRLKKGLFGLAKKIFLKKQEDGEQDYDPLSLLDKFGIREKVLLVNEFVPNEDVPQYFQASDAVLLFYEYATPSGVESISHNFEMPILATRVGHFPETVEEGYNGYLANPGDIEDMVRVMEKFIEEPIDRSNVAARVKEMSWENYARAIINC